MKKDFEQSKLLDALLADETWDTHSGHLQNNAIATVRARKKARARRTFAIQTMAVLAVVGAISLVLTRPERGWLSRSSNEFAGTPDLSSAAPSAPSPPAAHVTYISEDQMLAMFPQGSCVLAEIDGQKQLVLLDRAAIRHSIDQAEIQ
jgi:hypothetical protein